MPRVTHYVGDRVSLGFNLFDYKAGVWSSVSDGRGLELEVTESQSEGRMEMVREQEEGRNLFVFVRVPVQECQEVSHSVACSPANRLPASPPGEELCPLECLLS